MTRPKDPDLDITIKNTHAIDFDEELGLMGRDKHQVVIRLSQKLHDMSLELTKLRLVTGWVRRIEPMLYLNPMARDEIKTLLAECRGKE